MRRRFTAWLAIFALIAGAMLPAHAAGHFPAPAPGTDFCSTTSQQSAPAPARAHDAACSACCSCSGGLAVLPPDPASAKPLLAMTWMPRAFAVPAPNASPTAVLARGPPARASLST